MKKLLVLAALATLVATSAFAASGTITNSAHDLSGYSSNTDELCVYCHTPHGGTADAPLWNRGVNAMSYNAYNSATLQASIDLTVGDAKLCMTCHDGEMNDQLSNPPGIAQPDFTNIGSAFTGTTAIGTDDMTNDHPVGFNYADVITAGDAELNTGAPVDALLFSGIMWCSSCHDVHKPGAAATGDAPFLRVDNGASALCKTCHAK